MTRAYCLLLVALAATAARADTSADDHLARARDAHARGDFVHAREELLAAYDLDPQPALLFALGQVELNLGHFKEAIGYYERFKATNPPGDQAALAEQAIGAARIELERPKVILPPPLPPPPPPHRAWDRIDTAFTVAGGAALVASGALFYDASRLSQDRGGSLAAYGDRIDHAHLARTAGYVTGAAGVIAIGVALTRWRFHLVDTSIAVEASPTGATVSLGRHL